MVRGLHDNVPTIMYVSSVQIIHAGRVDSIPAGGLGIFFNGSWLSLEQRI
jgi:hypothetical protein